MINGDTWGDHHVKASATSIFFSSSSRALSSCSPFCSVTLVRNSLTSLAHLAVEQGESRETVILNAVGPESFTYRELVEELAKVIGRRRRLLRMSPALGHAVCCVMGWVIGDVVLTRDEIQGLMAGLLYVDTQSTGTTRLTQWLRTHADTLGRRYASELGRRVNR